MAIGELADGLYIDLNAVPKKYEGLDGTELAISESQERMAVVVAPEDADKFIAAGQRGKPGGHRGGRASRRSRAWSCAGTATPSCDITREFLNSNGAEKHIDVRVPAAQRGALHSAGGHALPKGWTRAGERSERLLQEGPVRAVRLHHRRGHGADALRRPDTSSRPCRPWRPSCPCRTARPRPAPAWPGATTPSSPNRARTTAPTWRWSRAFPSWWPPALTAEDAYLTFQEYFERLGADPTRWGKPMAALLGALDAQVELGVAAIGGKDSMSGTL